MLLTDLQDFCSDWLLFGLVLQLYQLSILKLWFPWSWKEGRIYRAQSQGLLSNQLIFVHLHLIIIIIIIFFLLKAFTFLKQVPCFLTQYLTVFIFTWSQSVYNIGGAGDGWEHWALKLCPWRPCDDFPRELTWISSWHPKASAQCPSYQPEHLLGIPQWFLPWYWTI